MSLIELHWALWAIGGVIAGGIIGYSEWGVLGAAVGVPLGLVAGFIGLLASTLILALLFKAIFGGPLLKPRKKG